MHPTHVPDLNKGPTIIMIMTANLLLIMKLLPLDRILSQRRTARSTHLAATKPSSPEKMNELQAHLTEADIHSLIEITSTSDILTA